MRRAALTALRTKGQTLLSWWQHIRLRWYSLPMQLQLGQNLKQFKILSTWMWDSENFEAVAWCKNIRELSKQTENSEPQSSARFFPPQVLAAQRTVAQSLLSPLALPLATLHAPPWAAASDVWRQKRRSTACEMGSPTRLVSEVHRPLHRSPSSKLEFGSFPSFKLNFSIFSPSRIYRPYLHKTLGSQQAFPNHIPSVYRTSKSLHFCPKSQQSSMVSPRISRAASKAVRSPSFLSALMLGWRRLLGPPSSLGSGPHEIRE